MVFPISDFRNRQREAGGLGKSSWAGEIVRASSRAGPLFLSKTESGFAPERFSLLRNEMGQLRFLETVLTYVRVRVRACVRACVRVCTCRRVGV